MNGDSIMHNLRFPLVLALLAIACQKPADATKPAVEPAKAAFEAAKPAEAPAAAPTAQAPAAEIPEAKVLSTGDWERVDVPGLKDDLWSVVRGKDLFVAVGDSGVLLTSADGTHWQKQISPADSQVNRVAYGADGFIAMAPGKGILASSEGTSWSLLPSNGEVFVGLVFDGKRFVALGRGDVKVSPDGRQWTKVATGSPYADYLTFGRSQYVAFGFTASRDTETTFVYRSDNLEKWESQDLGAGHTIGGAAFLDGSFLLLGAGEILDSADGRVWRRSTLSAEATLEDVAAGGGYTVAVGSGGATFEMRAGGQWEKRPSPVTTWLNGVAFGSGVFIAVGQGGTILVNRLK